ARSAIAGLGWWECLTVQGILGRFLMLYRAAIVLHTLAFVKCAASIRRCRGRPHAMTVGMRWGLGRLASPREPLPAGCGGFATAASGKLKDFGGLTTLQTSR